MKVPGPAVGMSSSTLVCLVLLLPGWGSAFRIRSSLTEINFLLEESLEVECSYSPEDTGLVSVEEIRVTKQDGRRGWKVMAKMYASSYTFQSDRTFQVLGQVGPEANATYLKLVWPTASEAEVGAYRCDLVGTDESNEFVVERTNVVSVHEHNVTNTDLIIMSQRQLDSLQLEFDQYKKEASKQIDSLWKKVQELQNRTSDSQVGDQTGPSSAEPDLDIDQLREEILTTVLTAVSLQVGNTTCSLVSRCFSDPPQDEPPVYTTPDDIVLRWPSGQFALLMPEAGCPESDHSPDWHSGFIGYHTESDDENHDNSSASIHMKEPVFITEPNGAEENHFVYMHFCSNGNSHPDSQEWPVGSYCINRVRGRCPSGFGSGYISVDQDDNDYSDRYNGIIPDMLYFCCRSDGDVSQAMRLPREAPFYLYRFGGKCQAVEGMAVTEENITLDTENDGNEDWYENNFHPDGQLQDVRIELCYYS